MSTIFMCWVKGGTVPKKRHETLEAAITEAKRLAKLPTCRGDVYVLSDIAMIEKESTQEQKVSSPVITIKKKRLTVLHE